jgi:hypothetical protein
MGYSIRIEIEETFDDGETNSHTQSVYNNNEVLTLDRVKDTMYYAILGAGFTYVSDVIVETRGT